MAKKGWTFARLIEVAGSGRDSLKGIDERLVVHVLVDPSAPRDLVCAARDILVPERPGAVVDVMALADSGVRGGEKADVALVLSGEEPLAGAVSHYARSGVPVGIIVEGALDVPALDLPEQALALVGVIAASSPESLPDRLAEWLCAAVDKSIALAANFSFCRRTVIDSLVSRCAAQNAAVGAISLIPGSDLPIMCANQAMLALDIAASYGRGLEPSRAAELAGVLGAGLVWRSVARSLVGLVPGLGMLLKAGIGYGGTLATGNALRLRFEAELSRESASMGEGTAECGEPPVLLATPGEAEACDYVVIGG